MDISEIAGTNLGLMSDDPLVAVAPRLRSSLVYFSSVSENTHRFVQKLGVPAIRIPLHGRIEVDEPYVLVLPTYGGGRATPDINNGGYVPKQVIAFLNNEHNRSLIRGVIAAGNNNFGAEFAYAGNVVSRKCGVPYLYRFELMGTADDVAAVRDGLAQFWAQYWKEQTCHQPSLQSL
jgi:protein involved in ribonucleotide reduction